MWTLTIGYLYFVKPPCRISLEPAVAQEQADPIPALGNNERSGSFALDKWLAEPHKDGPFNLLASARVPASEQAASVERTGASSPPRAPLNGLSSLGYIDNATGFSMNADKPSSR
ncbi:hypothetical protein GGI42DRAFT_309696 [Trichoderma sp. SZMC 28013]